MNRSRILIVCAVEPEARAIARAFCLPGRFGRAVEMNEEVAVGIVGMRGVRLEEVLQTLAGETFKGVILAGLGGGIAPELRVGDVVIEGPESGAALPGRVFWEGIVTVQEAVGTPSEKAAVRAGSGGKIVEMEGRVVRGRLGGAAWGQVRAVSDAAEEALDRALVGLVDEQGKPRAGRVAAYLGRAPWKLGALLRLKRSCDVALVHLTEVVRALVATGWPAVPESRASAGTPCAGQNDTVVERG